MLRQAERSGDGGGPGFDGSNGAFVDREVWAEYNRQAEPNADRFHWSIADRH